MQIGVIGLGRMGGNISRRLMKAGHQCVVFDADAKPREALAEEGARPSPPAGAHSISALVSRRRVASIICSTVIRPATTSSTYCAIGASTPLVSARARSEANDFAPSATWRVEATISSVLSPWPSFSPKLRLRESGEEQVGRRARADHLQRLGRRLADVFIGGAEGANSSGREVRRADEVLDVDEVQFAHQGANNYCGHV